MARKQAQNRNRTRETRPPAFIAWNVTERGEKSYWTRIGAAWEHKDSKGLSIQLEMVPMNGRLVLRTPDTEPEAETGGEGA